MKENQVSYLRLARNLHAFEPTGVAPALAFRRKLLRRILRVVNQDIRSLGELPEFLVKSRHAGLVVGSINYRAACRIHAITQASLRVIQVSGRDLGAVDFPLVAARNLVKFSSSRHHTDFYRKVRASELRFKDLAKTTRPQVFRLKAIEMKAILRLEERVKKWNALDVVPVIMGNENVGFDAMAAVNLRPAVPQHSQPSAAVQNKPSTVGGFEFQTRRIAAVAPCVALKRRRRAAHSPEGQFGNVVGHRRREIDASRLRSIAIS